LRGSYEAWYQPASASHATTLIPQQVFTGRTDHLWASEAVEVTELELSDCLMSYRYAPIFFKYLGMKTFMNPIKILLGCFQNFRSIL
jgi:hypothetical protein